MAGEVKFTGSGDPVLVVGPAPVRHTTADGGRTVEAVEQVTVVRFADGAANVEDVEPASIFDFRPTIDPDTAGPVTNEEGAVASPDEVPEEKRIVTEVPAAQRSGESTRAEQQDAEIAARVSESVDHAREDRELTDSDVYTDEQLQAELDRRRSEAAGPANTTTAGPEATGPPVG